MWCFASASRATGCSTSSAFLAHGHQARADHPLRRAGLPAHRGLPPLFQSQGGAAVRRRERTACLRCRAGKALTTRPPAPTCARWSARWPIADSGFGANEISLLVSATESAHPEEPAQHPRGAVAERGRHGRRGARPLSPDRHGLGGLRLPLRGRGGPGRGAWPTARRFPRTGAWPMVALGDTTGMATPASVRNAVSRRIRARAARS